MHYKSLVCVANDFLHSCKTLKILSGLLCVDKFLLNTFIMEMPQ